jgi:hypothetical protein
MSHQDWRALPQKVAAISPLDRGSAQCLDTLQRPLFCNYSKDEIILDSFCGVGPS